MTFRLAGPLAAVVVASASAEAAAAVWDTDTVAMAREPWPDTDEVIVGRFARHCDALYEWRVADRRARLVDAPDDLALLDDLGVALDKLDRHGDAIAVGLAALEIDPNRYRSLANLGTFFVHAGELQAGLEHLQRALAIDPAAAFGRERYEILLARETLAARAGATPRTFAAAVLAGVDVGERTAELERARRGVEAMLRLDDPASPTLLNALGSLLLARETAVRQGKARLLAARALLRAVMLVQADDPAMAETWRQRASVALTGERDADFAWVEYTLRWDLADAAAWSAQIERDELGWIADETLDPEAVFAAKYYRDPAGSSADGADAPQERRRGKNWRWLFWIPAGGAVLTVVLGRSHAMS